MNGDPISAAFFNQSSFATHCLTKPQNLVKVDTETDDATLAAFPCGVLTGAGIVFEQFDVQPDEGIVIFGVGAVGLSAVMAAKVVGASPIIVVDMKTDRLSLAMDLGATHSIQPQSQDVDEAVKSVSHSGVPYAIDTTGNAIAFELAIRTLITGGRMAMCILPSPMEDFEFKPFELFVKAASLEGVSFGQAVPQDLIPKLLALFEDGRFPVDRLVSTYDFADINTAVRDSLSGETIKPVLIMPSHEDLP